MKTKNQFCANCYFFYQTGSKDGASERIGYCRAEPPHPFYRNGLVTKEGEQLVTPQIARFPIVLGTMWCGMWEVPDED